MASKDVTSEEDRQEAGEVGALVRLSAKAKALWRLVAKAEPLWTGGR